MLTATTVQFETDGGNATSWPWGATWILSEGSGSGLVDEDGNPIGE